MYTPNSKKVAFGHWQLDIGKLLFGGPSSKALHCFRIPKAQLPTTNCQLKATFIELGIST